MRPSSCCFWVALLLLVGVCAAQSPTTADCNAEIVALLPCLDYVQGNVSTPSAGCCGGLTGVVQSNPTCLCVLANDSALPIRVDPIRATGLPAACNVTAPTIICGNGVAPVPEPVSSPPVSPPVTAPTAAPPAGTPTPVTTPLAPATPPVTPPAPTPIVAPAVTPIVAPAVPPPAPTTTPTVAPVTPPGLEPSSVSPLPSLSSPPAPPPAEDNSHGAAIAASFLVSGFAMVLSSILFMQL
ncbi:hypothetical protein L7F22_061079 [Adiantum nelumboides]|nr:hypothetical protein [Adiantum nelumboides]